jgi:hypothetical protein
MPFTITIKDRKPSEAIRNLDLHLNLKRNLQEDR